MNTAQTSLKSSNDEKQHVCGTCGKCFKSKCYLIVHKRIHSGEKPYNCDICDKSFAHKSNLTQHKLTGLKIYPCDVCKSCFAQRSHLKQHAIVMINVNSATNDSLKSRA